MRPRAVAAAALAAGLGAAIWGASPSLTGQPLPWGAETSYYPLALLAAGFVAGLAARAGEATSALAAFVGLLVGQLLYSLAVLPAARLPLQGGAVLAVSSGLAALAAAAGSRAGSWVTGRCTPARARTGRGADRQLRELVRERSLALRRRSYAELAGLAGGPAEHLRIGGRAATVATIVEPRANGALRVVVQGSLRGRFVALFQRVSVDGFYKHPDGSTRSMGDDEYLTNTSIRLLDP